jgi:hypothetical protein
MLNLPDPLAPFQDVRGKWVVNELVRVNHLRNCLLCHPPSNSTRDLLRGMIPSPGAPLPVAYYNSRGGSFVKADVTYLKQDFSATLPVVDHDEWPAQQRYDFFIRTRQVSANERMAWSNKNQQDRRAPLPKHGGNSDTYPQREAVLYAIEQLTRGSRTQATDIAPEPKLRIKVIAVAPRGKTKGHAMQVDMSSVGNAPFTD